MKTINKRLIGLLIISAFQLIFPLIFISAKEKVIEQGKEYLFQIQPVDPYDFFQGRYIILNVKQLTFASNDLLQFKKNDVVFAEFDQDSTGASIQSVSPDITTHSLKLKLYSTPNKLKKMVFYLPFKRFYLEEGKAQKIERKLARSQSNKNYVHVKILNGEYVLSDISSAGISLISGKTIQMSNVK